MKYSTILLTLFAFAACSGKNKEYNSPKSYDLNHPQIYNMPGSLFEISGIAFFNGHNDTLFAEQDEEGAVYTLTLGRNDVQKTAFKKHGDFEDIAICNNMVIMLLSDGKLYGMPLEQVRCGQIDSVKEWRNLLPQGEYEGLYADNTTQKIYVLYKTHPTPDEHKKTSGYIFQLDSHNHLAPAGQFHIPLSQIEERSGKHKMHFKPSALAQNPKTKEWYILSSVNKMLVVTDTGWQVKAVWRLNPGLYIQPEGIAFDSDNNLYISNEGSKTTPGTVFKFNYTQAP
ncbi:MAG TPA: SdiA-regulated domain-containing protein [Edaphocola sp.]|nr:SdiA-regulated domain-containing protein [Edaphocola sp.]